MKNQYFGDVNDYRKYGVLRALCGDGALSLAVAWMLTPGDGGSDGGFRNYLHDPRRWAHHDPELFNWLVGTATATAARRVDLIQESCLLRGATYFSELVPDGGWARAGWSRRMIAASSGHDLVFLDPDNGMQVPSKPPGRKDSSKYALWSEVSGIASAGSSVLIYQHFRREDRSAFATRMMDELRERTDAPLVSAFRTPHVLFLLAAQPPHVQALETGIERILPRWHGQIERIGAPA